MSKNVLLGCVLASVGSLLGCQGGDATEQVGAAALPLEAPACVAGASGPGIFSGNLAVNAATDPQTLADLWCVTGHLDIDAVSWTDLAPLAHLQAVVGRLGVTNSGSLLSLNGLQALQRTGALYLTNDAKLESLDALPSLTNLGALGLNQLPRLRNLHGLEQITTTGAVTIGSNALLTSLEGLRLRETNGIFAVTNNPGLTSLAGTEALRRVGLDLWLISNDALLDLEPLAGVSYVGRTIRVSQHDRLTSLAGLRGITRPGPFSGNLQVFGNPFLDQCQVQALVTQTGLPCGSCADNHGCAGATAACSALACVAGACTATVSAGSACGAGGGGICSASGACETTLALTGGSARTFVDAGGDGSWDSSNSSIEVAARNVPWLGQRWLQRTALEWSLAAIPAGASLVRASLKLDVWGAGYGSGFDVELRGYAGDGALGVSDADAGGDVLATHAVNRSTSSLDVEVDLTALLASLRESGAPALGLNLRASSEAERLRTVDDRLACVSFGQGSAVFNEPSLKVTYVNP